MDWKRAGLTKLRLLLPLLVGTVGLNAMAHPGGLNAEGCHNNRKTGEYHCHGTGAAISSTGQSATRAHFAGNAGAQPQQPSANSLPPGCFVGPRGGTYTITKSGRKNYAGC